MLQKKKILYFDYWTVGIKNFKVFDSHLKSSGFNTRLLHLNSWRGLAGSSLTTIDGIECIDIKHYGSRFLHDVLAIERPLAVVMLNSSFVTDRTIILSCKKLDIPCIYLMHGALTREEFIEENVRSINTNLKWRKYTRGLRHLKRTVVNYLNSSIQYDRKSFLRVHPYKVLLNTLFNPGTYLHFPPPAFDLTPDLALVYGLSDALYYRKRMQLSKESVKIVGNPELDNYFRQLDSLGSDKEQFLQSHGIPANVPYVTYVEEGLAEDGIWHNNYRTQFLSEVNEVCKEEGFHLVIKLHPRTARGPFSKSFQELKDATIIDSVNFPKLIFHSEKCISHYSTTLIYAMLLEKPILVPKWGKSAEIPNLYTHKEVTAVTSLEQFRSMLRQKVFQYDRDEYIRNLVPFKDGKTSERIANEIMTLVQ